MANKQADLQDEIMFPSVESFNEHPNFPIQNALKQGYREDDGLVLQSDDDEQLLINIPFNQVVKLHSIIIKGPEDEGPKVIKLYANRPSMGFSNTSDYPPSDTLILSKENLKGEPVLLKYVKFQNVSNLSIFVEENQSGSEVTKIQKIAILGRTVETTKMSEFKKIDDGH